METQLCTRLKQLRKEALLSPAFVIKELEKSNLIYSVPSLYKWEQGKVIPELNVIKALSAIYNCNVSYLIDTGNVANKTLSPNEIFLLKLFRNDFLFRSIAVQILRKYERYKIK